MLEKIELDLLLADLEFTMSECVKWANEYFGEYPDTKVELILLFQAVPAVDLKTSEVAISHCFLCVRGPFRALGGGRTIQFGISPLIIGRSAGSRRSRGRRRVG